MAWDDFDNDGQTDFGNQVEWQWEQPYPRRIRTVPTTWPYRRSNVQNQIQQIKVGSQPSRISPIAPTSTQAPVQVKSINMPKPVTGVSVNRQSISATQVKVSVRFSRDTSDPYYQKANVHLKTTAGLNQVVSGVESPLEFIASKTTMPASVIVQTEGSWGANPIENSPGVKIRLGETSSSALQSPVNMGGGGSLVTNNITPATNVDFNNINSGENMVATMVVGPGASLTIDCNNPGGIIEATELATNTCTPVETDLSAPTHPGQLLISQPGNASAIWADPQVQGLYPTGSDVTNPPAYVPPTTIEPVLAGVAAGRILENLLTPDIYKTAQTQGGTPLQLAIWTPDSGFKFVLMKFQVTVSGNAHSSSGVLLTFNFTDGLAGPNVGPTYDVWIQPGTDGNVTGYFTGTLFDTGLFDMGNGYQSTTINNSLYFTCNATLTTGYIRVNVMGCEV